MRAISLWQPWAWLLCRGHDHPDGKRVPWEWLLCRGHEHPAGKRVENRSWPLPVSMQGEWCLVHAARHGKTGMRDEHLGFVAPEKLRQAQEVACLAGWPEDRIPSYLAPLQFGGLVGVVRWGFRSVHGEDPRTGEAATVLDSLWFEGPYGWPTLDAKPLPFVPWKGRQGFFDVPVEELLAAFQAALEKATDGVDGHGRARTGTDGHGETGKDAPKQDAYLEGVMRGL